MICLTCPVRPTQVVIIFGNRPFVYCNCYITGEAKEARKSESFTGNWEKNKLSIFSENCPGDSY